MVNAKANQGGVNTWLRRRRQLSAQNNETVGYDGEPTGVTRHDDSF
jgi:hypothetical protein